MRKDSLICFRLSKNLHESLLKVAQDERRSLSSTIEIILANYLKEKKIFKVGRREKRSHPRKTISVPAFINRRESTEARLQTGSITDISLNGVCVLIPRDVHNEISGDRDKANFEIIFTLPNEKRPIHLMCEPRRVMDSKEFIQVGATFVDADFSSYKALQTYLM